MGGVDEEGRELVVAVVVGVGGGGSGGEGGQIVALS